VSETPTAYDQHLASLRPSIEVEDGNGVYELKVSVKAQIAGITFNPAVFVPALEAFMAAVAAAVEAPDAS